MPVHFYQQGRLSKKADEGLTFEQQMGTMTSARVGEKFPMLAPYVVGFELLKKDEDGTYGVGTMVYMMGDQAFYIPSFYNHGRFRTGEIIVLRDQQQFIPATEGLISYMKARYDKGAGEIFPRFKQNIEKGAPGSVKVKEDDFPLAKGASLEKDTNDIFSVALSMGKQASAQLIDIITANTRIFNDFADFYGLDKIAAFKTEFEKQHAPKDTPLSAWIVDPLDKQATTLTEEERKSLNMFGFLIKTARNEFPGVEKADQISEQFVSCNSDGVYEVLADDGSLNKAVVIRMKETDPWGPVTCDYRPRKGFNSVPDSFLHPSTHLDDQKTILIFFNGKDNTYQMCSFVPTGRRIGDISLTSNVLKECGQSINSVTNMEHGDIIICPDGSTIQVRSNMHKITSGDGESWIDNYGDNIITVSDVLKHPRRSGNTITIPVDCVVIEEAGKAGERPEDMSWEEWDKKKVEEKAKYTFNVAHPSNVQNALFNFINSRYTTVKIFSNGSSFTVSGDNSDPKDVSIKEASYTLAKDYGVNPLDAPYMVLESYPKDGTSNTSVRWCIEKNAADGDYSRGASPYDIPNLGYNEVPYDGPKTETIGSDGIIPAQGATREQIMEQVQRAADSGVKEIFDVSIMKTLVSTSRPEALIGDYTSTILKMMDRLCRMLFLGYVQEDDFKTQYGDDKYEEYMETIRNAMDDLSELFVFVSTRSVLADSMDTDGSDELTDGNI